MYLTPIQFNNNLILIDLNNKKNFKNYYENTHHLRLETTFTNNIFKSKGKKIIYSKIVQVKLYCICYILFSRKMYFNYLKKNGKKKMIVINFDKKLLKFFEIINRINLFYSKSFLYNNFSSIFIYKTLKKYYYNLKPVKVVKKYKKIF